MSIVPKDLEAWLQSRGASHISLEVTPLPQYQFTPTDDKVLRKYVLATVNLRDLNLDFKSHKFNPRTPNRNKVNVLKASMIQLNMLSPLICAYIPKENLKKDEDEVLLIDGRHRYDALCAMKTEFPEWGKKAQIDLKIFVDLQRSDLHVMATYLNKIRQPLKKGEYFRAIFRIYEDKKEELTSKTGKTPTEEEVFRAISTEEFTDRNFAFSIGRIVGMTALDPEEGGAWYPLVGDYQNAKYSLDGQGYYCSITAGNVAEFLKFICKAGPYNDNGDIRSNEIGNVVELGISFSKRIMDIRISDRSEDNHTTVGCKFWCVSALGKLLSLLEGMPRENDRESIMAQSDTMEWGLIDGFFLAYSEIMDDQAEKIHKYKQSEQMIDLKLAWSHQTQRDQVKKPLEDEFIKRGFQFREG